MRVGNPLADVDSGSDEIPSNDNVDNSAKMEELRNQSGIINHLFFPELEESELEQWMVIRRPFVMHPECNFRKYWDLFSMVLIVYSCVTIPYRLGFSVDPTTTEEAFDRMVDGVFMIDCILTFKTACVPVGVLVTDFASIAKNYMKGWFFLDFFSSFPFDLLLSTGGDGDSGGGMDPETARILKMIRIFRMVKILRMVRIKRRLKKFQDSMSIKNGVMLSVKFLIVVIMASHFMACLWFNMSTSVPSNNWALSYCIWANVDNFDEGCGNICNVLSCRDESGCGEMSTQYRGVLKLREPILAENGLSQWVLDLPSQPSAPWWPQNSMCDPKKWNTCTICIPWTQYIASIYYALVTMTTIGYGDVLPMNSSERLFATGAMLTGASIFAYAITNMCTVVHNLNPSDVVAKARMDELTDYANFLAVPKLIKKKLMEYYFYKIQRSSVCHYNEAEIFKDMSESMRLEIRWVTRRKAIEFIPFLEELLPQVGADGVALRASTATAPQNPLHIRFCALLATKLQSEAYAPNDLVVKQGNIAIFMSIYMKGSAQVEKNSEIVSEIRDGAIVTTVGPQILSIVHHWRRFDTLRVLNLAAIRVCCRRLLCSVKYGIHFQLGLLKCRTFVNYRGKTSKTLQMIAECPPGTSRQRQLL